MGGEANIGAGGVGGIKRPVSEVSSYYRMVPKKAFYPQKKERGFTWQLPWLQNI